MTLRRRPPRGAGRAGRPFWSDRAGVQAVEFALTAPALLLMIFGAMEFGRLLWTQSALHASVEQAARCGAVALCTTGTAAAYATTVTPSLNFSTSVFTAANATCGFKVTASYTFVFIATGLFSYTPTLTAAACIP